MMTRPATALAGRLPAARLLAVACAIAPLAGPAWADGAAAERLYRIEALGHAGAIEDAYRALETHIRETSTAPTGPAAWPGDGLTPVAPWRQRWTARGLAARYCEDVLLVYADAQALKGVGLDHDSVRIAPRTYGPELGQLARAPLHRIENQDLYGGEGRPALALPACLHGASFGALPNDRVALAGLVPDPLAAHNRIERRSREWSTVDCPALLEGPGRTLTRESVQWHDGRGTPVGEPVPEPWEVFADFCRPIDATSPPPLPEPGVDPTVPEPAITHSVREESRELDCPAGETGAVRQTWRITVTTTRFPWDTEAVVRERIDDWQVQNDDCRPIPVEEERDDCGWRESGYGEDWGIVYTCGGGGGGGDGGDHGGGHGGDQDGNEDGSDDTGGPGEGSDDGPGGADNADGNGDGSGDGDGGGDGGGSDGGGEGDGEGM